MESPKPKKGAGGRKGGGPKKKSVSRSIKAGLQVGRIRYSQKGPNTPSHVFRQRRPGLPRRRLEYLAAEVLELAGNAARDNKKNRIIPRHVLLAIRNDEELGKLLAGVTIAHGSAQHQPRAFAEEDEGGGQQGAEIAEEIAQESLAVFFNYK
ncbi:uncharacterized protein A4U43_C07F2650 [Asparagus officinalis]|uniref:Histone H2A n=1 Tax=Asparagus officinalis TaxID=4686 RepID=A0A5P1EAT5_ASPOF|nr:uncharacterized protein A4U43_C07F2650 [Asparagus officinalis]